eukprot:748803-Hanusia_phi.AAC.1
MEKPQICCRINNQAWRKIDRETMQECVCNLQEKDGLLGKRFEDHGFLSSDRSQDSSLWSIPDRRSLIAQWDSYAIWASWAE